MEKKLPGKIGRWVSLVLMLMVFGANAEENPLTVKESTEESIDNIATLSMPEAESSLNDLISELGHSINRLERKRGAASDFFDATDRKMEISQKKLDSSIEYEEPFTLLTSQQLTEQLNLLKKQPIKFKQILSSENSKIRFSDQNLDDLVGLTSSLAEYKITHLYFSDGSEQKFAPTIEDPSIAADGYQELSSPLTLTTKKPLDRMVMDVRYSFYPSYQKVVLDKDNKKVTNDDGSSYELIGMQEGMVALQFTLPLSATYLVEGLTAGGKSLRMPGSTTLSVPSKGQIEQLKLYHQALVKTRDNIKQFADSNSLQQHLEKISAEFKNDPEDKILILKNLTFVAQPQSVVLYILPEEQTRTVSQNFANSLAKQDLYIAKDDATDKFGFIDKRGNWVIKPQFAVIESNDLNIKGIYRVHNENPSQNNEDSSWLISSYISVDPKTRQIIKMPFESILENVGDDLYLVQKTTNGSYGLYNFRTRQFVIPMKFVNPKIVNGLFIASLGEKTDDYQRKYGAYTLTGKPILPPNYYRIEYLNGYLYATPKQEGQKEVYTLQGKKINPPG
ncbi:WG repeat-containing protein [Serratia sp. DD3]|uniref:WG repeat-containing protein n=1 Tax=Serratia sp. DD3 TaxID=1410619 RepID=UPI0003C517CB|nr:WG repeat-containing protein [Serratia sp. DD3]KEY60118.1 hypothetical protein SRDD_09720 [Serratia sp. DD3]